VWTQANHLIGVITPKPAKDVRGTYDTIRVDLHF
jgi:hypothetical protein